MISQITIEDIIRMIVQAGEEWAIAHAKRLIELVRQIGVDVPYDAHVIELAAYLHDWGAFSIYFQKDGDHAARSRQVVESTILPYLHLTTDQNEILLETIELHDYRDMRLTKSNEALLLREADMLEFLGVMGMVREFTHGPNDVEACYKRILSRHDGIQGRFTLPRAKEIAKVRLERMETNLKWLHEESLGIL